MFCPNYKIKEVKDGFNEIIEALGGKPMTDEEFKSSELRNKRTGLDYSAMESAYKIYHRNNGNMLDMAPNGEHSVLWDSILEYTKGDRIKAAQIKANVYSDEFFNWFGNWTGSEDFKEKKIKSAKNAILDLFEESKVAKFEDKVLLDLVENSDISLDQANSLMNSIKQFVIDEEKVPGKQDREKLLKYAFGEDAFEQIYFADDSKEDIQFDLPNDETDARIEFYNLQKKHKELNLKFNHFEEIKEEYNKLFDEFEKILQSTDLFQSVYDLLGNIKTARKNIESSSISKVVDQNGEPLIVRHHTDNENLNEFSTDFDNYFSKDGGTKKAIFFDEEVTGTLNRKYDIPVYLNIRELNEYNETKQQLHEKGTTYREIVNQSAEKNDTNGGVHMKDFDDNKKEHQSIWIVHNSNQIKHVENLGTWSTEDNDIYHENRSHNVIGSDRDSRLVSLSNKKEVSIKDIIDIISQSSDYGPIIEMLKERSKIKDGKLLEGVQVRVETPFGSFKEKYNGRRAFYDASDNTIYINALSSFKNGDSSDILMHEVLHAITVDRLHSDKNFRNWFEDILNRYQEQYKKENNHKDYKYENDEHRIEEFIADIWSDEDLIRRLDRYEGKKQSLWQKIKKYLVQFFIGNPREGSLLEESSSALYKLLDAPITTKNKESYYAPTASRTSTEIAEEIDDRRNQYIQNVVDNYTKDTKLKDQALQDQLIKVRDKAREQFDQQELNRINNDDTMSDVEKQIALGLVYRDLEIVSGLQNIVNPTQKTKDQEAFEQIKEGTKTRLKSHLSRNIKNTKLINSLKEQIAAMEEIDVNDVDQMFNQIAQFLENAEIELYKTRNFIESELIGKDISTWDPQQINYIRYDLLGHYEGLLRTVYGLFNGDSPVAQLNKARVESDPNVVDLQKKATELYSMIDPLQTDYQDKVVLPYAEKVLIDFVADSDAVVNKNLFINNMKKWLYQDTAYGDLAAGEIVLGMASRSRSSIVRIMEKMISDVEFEKNRQMLQKGNELIRLYNEVRPTGSQISFRNFQTLFMERDGEDGTSGDFTGYFSRDRNYGRFYKNKDAFEEKLREKYEKKGLKWTYNDVEERYNLIFPDEDTTKDDSVYNQYYDELDEWLDKHCERRYKLEYYKKKRRFLSPAALQAQQFIQHQIDLIAQDAINEDGYIDSSKLTPTQKQRIKDLRKQKRELACPYVFDSLSDGTVTLREKVGEDARIASEISKWNKFIQNHVKYKQNDEKFNKALNRFEKDSPEYKQFIKDNTIQIINPKFWEYLRKSNTTSVQTAEYEELKERYRAIVEHIKRQQGMYVPDLDLLGSGINTDTSVWQELQRLEQRMEEIRTPSEYNANGYMQSFLVASEKQNKEFLHWLQERWQYEISANPSAQKVFNKLFTYTDKKGRQRFLKIFGFNVPNQFTVGPGIPTVIKQYSSQFSELDESSDFVNPNYDKTLKASMQPKVRKAGTKRVAGAIDYTNDNYNKIVENEGYKKLYDKLVGMMEEANSMIPRRAVERRFLLPQITGRAMSILGRSRGVSDVFASLNYGLQDWTGLKFDNGRVKFDESLMEKDSDVSTNWDLPRRPDGTIVNNIPLRFVKRLEDPSIISSDIIGSVLMYYDMALNFKLKSEKLPALELMQEAINPEKKSGGKKLRKQYEKVKNMMDYRYYGKESKMGDDDTKPHSKFYKATMQISKKFKHLASLSMLGINFTTIEVGYIDAFLKSVADATGGKYFTKTDLLVGWIQTIRHLPNMLANLGNPVVDDWMVAAMQYNQLSKSNSEIFGRTDQSRWSRLLSNIRMGGYTMADYMMNTMILGATYNHYRLVEIPDGTKKFLSKTESINQLGKFGYSEKEAINKWNSSKTTLKEAYKVEDGLLVVKNEYKQYITNKLENQIAGRLRDRTALYNGVIPMSEKATLQQNVFGSYLTMMRNFYVNNYWERASIGYDYATEEEIHSSKLGAYTADTAGFVNFETGESGNGLWWSFLKGMYKYVSNVKQLIQGKDLRQLTYDQKYAVKRILTELATIAITMKIMLFSIAFARSNDYDDDKDPTWSINIFSPEGEDLPILYYNGNNHGDKFNNWLRWKMALLATRTFVETSTFYWPGTVTELITSPSTAKSYLDDIGYSLELFMDLFEINGRNRNEVVRSGGYKGMTRGTRDIMKITGATGIDNLVRGWHTSGIKSTLNWYSGVAPNNLLIPNKSTWEKEQGITPNKKNKLVY